MLEIDSGERLGDLCNFRPFGFRHSLYLLTYEYTSVQLYNLLSSCAESNQQRIAAMTSSAGSNVFALTAIIAICTLVLLLLRHFLPLRSTPAYLLVPIFLALALPISTILLVPIDLASSSRNEDDATRGIWLPQSVVLVAWRIIYWLTFALTWWANPS